MSRYKIADVVFEAKINYAYTARTLRPYEYGGEEEPAFTAIVTAEDIEEERVKSEENDNFPDAYLESLALFRKLCNYLLDEGDGIVFHSSAVMVDGEAYLFTAPSGTGKSTHTHLWLKYLPGARIINDDKPALRIIDSRVYAFGTPWSGKTDENINIGVPVGGIAFLSRGENKIERVPGAAVLKAFMGQTVRPVSRELVSALFDVTDTVLSTVPVYKFSCDMSEDAVKTALEGMRE